jgi:tRNA modification GTPase
MFTVDDTIVAIATPVGRGGIGVVRVSGPDAARIAATLTGSTRTLEPRQATFGRIEVGGVVGHATTADQVIVTFFPSPHSYTGEDVVEISGHGSPLLLRAIVSAAIEAGARLAEPGEFTFRAFLRERIDLVQAEAVRDLIDAVTPLQARAAYDQLEGTLTGRIKATDQRLFDLTVRLEASLDFPEEGYHFVGSGDASREIGEVAAAIDELLVSAARGRLVREGLQAALVGRPNAGKSSLFNALAGAGRAIVTDIPGTTRDLLTEVVDVDGIPLTLVDTAGIREGAADPIEREGINRALVAAADPRRSRDSRCDGASRARRGREQERSRRCVVEQGSRRGRPRRLGEDGRGDGSSAAGYREHGGRRCDARRAGDHEHPSRRSAPAGTRRSIARL